MQARGTSIEEWGTDNYGNSLKPAVASRQFRVVSVLPTDSIDWPNSKIVPIVQSVLVFITIFLKIRKKLRELLLN